MLVELGIADLGVLDEVRLELEAGLTVVTGETGAGKTMVVSALELLTGARADVDQVRAGSASARVEAAFHPPPPGSAEWLDEGDEELLVAREVVAAGRSRARLGGRTAPVSALAALVGPVVEIHGQSDSASLGTPAVQRALLDRSGGAAITGALESYAATYGAWSRAREELATLTEGAREAAREADRLTFELGEIDAVAPQAGEEETLAAELVRLEHGEALVAAAAAAAAAIADEGGARDGLGAAVASLRSVAGVDQSLERLHERVEGLAAEAQDLGMELQSYAEGLEVDEKALAGMRERRAALTALTRKYGPDLDAVLAYADDARERLALATTADERRAALESEIERLADRLAAEGARLRSARAAAGQRLVAVVEGHLEELAMAGARMTVAVEEAAPGPQGADSVAFLLAANAGEPALPLGKAASGGERSRVALSVRLALADADATPVLVFDEVDAGIGGAVALEVGRKLARLARGRQVLCVTHLAQLAAFADAHVVVRKETAGGRTRAEVRTLADDERVTELARLLSGQPDSEAATRHAAELLATARG